MLFADELRELVAKKQLVVIVGSGVSFGASNSPLSTWTGLLRNGIDYCDSVIRNKPLGWAERMRQSLDHGDIDEWLSVADQISIRLQAPSGGDFKGWLRKTIGNLEIVNRDVINAIINLNVLITTTNYDSLFEIVSGYKAYTWRDKSDVERTLSGENKAVIHLHGHWERSESIILGRISYENIQRDSHAQTILKTLRTSRRMLFIGCGDGLTDPNIGELLRWSESVFQESEYRQYILARNQDVERLAAQHAIAQRAVVVPYGDNFDDLAPFLSTLTGPSEHIQNARENSFVDPVCVRLEIDILRGEFDRLQVSVSLPESIARLHKSKHDVNNKANILDPINRLIDIIISYNQINRGIASINIRRKFVIDNHVNDTLNEISLLLEKESQ